MTIQFSLEMRRIEGFRYDAELYAKRNEYG